MTLAHLELLAEIDGLLDELKVFASRSADWPAARHAQALVERLRQRADTLRVRWDAPLVVATLGGTGTGKSSLVNALVGSQVTEPGRQRPTTRKPVLICRPDVTAEHLGIPPESVERVARDLPALRDMVLIDCPDPDTTEDAEAPGTNLARLRELLPHCDVLLITTTQQKYRSARVADELAMASPGVRLVFVQTHADSESDIREDWQRVLAAEYTAGDMFFVDSLSALADAQEGVSPRGEFGRLLDFLSSELAGTAARRIRRVNFLDLVAGALSACRQRIEAELPAVRQLEAGITEQRGRLAAKLASQMRLELLGSRRPWENRLLDEVASRWGFSPFSCLLRLYQGLGGLLSGAALFRARTPAQMALWGAMEGGRRWKGRRSQSQADAAVSRAVAIGWDEGQLRTAAIIIDGYTSEAGLPRDDVQLAVIEEEAAAASAGFMSVASAELQALVGRLAARHTGWFVRWRYELALILMLGLMLYRFGRNFFYDSWLAYELGSAARPQPVLGTDFFIGAGFVLLLWCGLLLWAFTSRLRRGVAAQIDQLAAEWNSPHLVAGIFARLEARCRSAHALHQDLERLQARVAALHERVAIIDPRLGHRNQLDVRS